MSKFKPILIILAFILALTVTTLLSADTNVYEEKLIGVWENDEEPDLIVFEEDNICYMMDEDEIKLTENGRWSATATTISMELKYNGKKYRNVFKYEFIDDDTAKLKIIKSLIDGKEDKLPTEEDSVFIVKRWEY